MNVQEISAAERTQKVYDWINARPIEAERFSTKTATIAIFGEGSPFQNYVSCVLSRHSQGDDSPLRVVGKMKRTGRGGQSEFIYVRVGEVPLPRFSYTGATRARLRGSHSVRPVPIIDSEFSSSPKPSVTERLLELAIAADRGQPILRDLLRLAADIVEE